MCVTARSPQLRIMHRFRVCGRAHPLRRSYLSRCASWRRSRVRGERTSSKPCPLRSGLRNTIGFDTKHNKQGMKPPASIFTATRLSGLRLLNGGRDKSGVSCKCLRDKKKKKKTKRGEKKRYGITAGSCDTVALRAESRCHMSRDPVCSSRELSWLSLCKLQSMAALKSEGEEGKKKQS